MQEFETTLLDLRQGLRKEKAQEMNKPFLSECVNLRPTAQGLESIPTPSAQFSPVGSTQSAYFPAIHPSSFQTLGLYENISGRLALGSLEDDGTLSSTIFSGYASSIADGTLAPVTLNGEPVEIVEEQGLWLLADGTNLVTNSEVFSARWAHTSCVVSDEDTAVPRSVCLWGSRLVCANFTEGAVFSTDVWARMWEERAAFSPEQMITRGDWTVDPSKLLFIWESKGGDWDRPFTPALIFMYNYGVEAIEEILADLVRSQRLSILAIKARGDILHVRSIDNRLFVFTTEEVVQVVQTEDGFIQLPLTRRGIAHAGAICATPGQIHWLDSRGFLWRMLNEYIPIPLGYEEFFRPLLDASYRCGMVYDSMENEHYLTFYGASPLGFILTETGLGETRYCYSGLARFGADIVGAYHDTGVADFTIVTNTFDMNRRGIKFIPQVIISQQDCTDITIQLDYKYSRNDVFVRSTAIPVNDKDIAHVRVSGSDLRAVIKGTPSEGCFIDRIHMKWKAADNRDARGFTTQPEQQL